MEKKMNNDERRDIITEKIEKGFKEALETLSPERLYELMRLLEPLSSSEMKFISTIGGAVAEGIDYLREMNKKAGGNGNPNIIWEFGVIDSTNNKTTGPLFIIS